MSSLSELPVPRIVHQIWLQGADRMPHDVEDMTTRVRRMATATEWEYRLWSDADLLALPEYAELRPVCPAFFALSDLGRYSALWHFGGLYLDADIVLYRLPKALTGAWCVGGGNHVMAAPPQHPRIRTQLDHIRLPHALDGISATYAELFMNPAGWDHLWRQDEWDRPAKHHGYGHHFSHHREWGSMVPLGDTFPPGAKV